MTEWKKTQCWLCPQTCGLELLIKENRIVRIKGDKENPRSRGYLCNKGLNIHMVQHNADRLTHPLKKTDSGHVEISWEQAIDEIAQKLNTVTREYGSDAFAYMGGGGGGWCLEFPYANAFRAAVGSPYIYNSMAQEFSGIYWVHGRMTGCQSYLVDADVEHADMVVMCGWNGMESHQIARAPKVLRAIAKDPAKLLVVIDPRKSESARIADIHLALRPGTDALLARAMCAILIKENLVDEKFIQDHTLGYPDVRPWFSGFDIKGALDLCGLDLEAVLTVCREFAARTSCLRQDLGVFMNRHSTAASYLYALFTAMAGRMCQPGGNVILGAIGPQNRHTDWFDPDIPRTWVTGFPPVNGIYPPAVLPEEILSSHPGRIRAMICSSHNPLRSYPDTRTYERALKALDLLVVMEITMTETARAADYILPVRSCFEAWETTIYTYSYPEYHLMVKHPVIEPGENTRESGEVLTDLAAAMGILPKDYHRLKAAASAPREEYLAEMVAYIATRPDLMEVIPLIIGDTLGREMNSSKKAILWTMLMILPELQQFDAHRAGFDGGKGFGLLRAKRKIADLLGPGGYNPPSAPPEKRPLPLKLMEKTVVIPALARSVLKFLIQRDLVPGMKLGKEIFEAVMAHPEGVVAGICDPEDNFDRITWPDKKIRLHFPEMEAWIKLIEPSSEAAQLEGDPRYPFVLHAGRHYRSTANTAMRDPAWLKGKAGCTLLIHPKDGDRLGVSDGQEVRVVTPTSELLVPAEVTDSTRQGVVIIPHGFGLVYNGETYGVNVNQLTSLKDRDPLCGTPWHRYVRCRLERVKGVKA